jgi:hypothetical protein
MKELKWILISVSILIVVIIFGMNSCSRKKFAKQEVAYAELNLKNETLNDQVKLREVLIKSKDIKIGLVEANLKVSELEKEKLKVQLIVLRGQYLNLISSLDKIPTDSSYLLLTRYIYVFDGKNQYPFNASQIKAIHLTYLQKNQLDKINDNLKSQVENCESRVVKKDSIIQLKNDKINYLNQTVNAQDSIILNDTAIIELKDKQIGKEKRRKNFWKILSTIITGALIGTNI